jgi:uncharacterized RDD family membrane protein YckC
MEVLDEIPDYTRNEEIAYATFGTRISASITDGIILIPLVVVPNIIHFSLGTFQPLIISLIALSYRPVFEAIYGATPGKMLLKIKVINYSHKSPTFGEALIRNIFHILPQLMSVLVMIMSYTSLIDIPVYDNYEYLRYVNIGFGLITLVDAIVLLRDDKNQSLHDKLAKTYVVIKNESTGPRSSS